MNHDHHASPSPQPQPSCCDKVRARLTLYLLGDLDENTTQTISAHLEACDGCRAFAQEMEPTLDLLRGALAADLDADAPRLSPERHRNVAHAWRRAATKRTRRRPLIIRFHIMEAAAAVLAGLFLWGLFIPGRAPRSEQMRRAEVNIVELEAVRDAGLEALPLPDIARPDVDIGAERMARTVPSRERRQAHEAVAEEGLPPENQHRLAEAPRSTPVPTGEIRRRLEGRRLKEIAAGRAAQTPEAFPAAPPPVDVDFMSDPTLPPAPPAELSPEQATFDAVAMMRSPIVMRGLADGRSAPESISDATPADDLVTIHEPQEYLGEMPVQPDVLPPLPPDEPEDEPVDLLTPPHAAPARYNPIVETGQNPFSTFAIDVDTASYTLARNYMLRGFLPPPEAVRTEEFVNFFDYAYEAPVRDTFRIYTEAAPSRFGHGMHLLKIGVKGRRLGREEQRPASLTILVDSSGSMNQPDRIGLVRRSLEKLMAALDEGDQVAVIQFDSRARLLLSHTPVAQRERIQHAIDSIQCGGATNLEAGLRLAFEQASRNFISGAENRILLLSDGVVNIGDTVAESIFAQLADFRRQGLYMSVFGFGMGTYDDTMLKTLARKGNGAYAFIDSEDEARRVFVDDLGATLNTIAEDVRIQVEFNPRLVTRYRQLGYELRQMKREQFRDDTVDAGEIGSGQSVTALYELDLTTAAADAAAARQRTPAAVDDNWLAVVRVRYRRVDNRQIEEIERRVFAHDVAPSFDEAGVHFRLAACGAAFAESLRGSPFVELTSFADLAEVLRPVALELSLDARIRELARLVEAADGMSRE